jgi:Holliday junction resolvase RusA-like endonuclease
VIFCDFTVAIPKSDSKNERAAAIGGSKWPRADVDNLLKSVADVLTHIGVWVDDSVVVAFNRISTEQEHRRSVLGELWRR